MKVLVTVTPAPSVQVSGSAQLVLARAQAQFGGRARERRQVSGHCSAGRAGQTRLQHEQAFGAVAIEQPHRGRLALDQGIVEQIRPRELTAVEADLDVEHVGDDVHQARGRHGGRRGQSTRRQARCRAARRAGGRNCRRARSGTGRRRRRAEARHRGT